VATARNKSIVVAAPVDYLPWTARTARFVNSAPGGFAGSTPSAPRRILLSSGPLTAAADAAIDDIDTAPFFGSGAGVGPVLGQLAPFVQWRAMPSPRGLASSWAALMLQGGTTLGAAGLGPRSALAELFVAFIRQRGGESVRDRVVSVDATGRTITTLRLEHGRDDIIPTAVIDATWSRDFVDRLPSGRAREKLVAQQGRVISVGGSTSVRWLLPARALPRGMPPVMLALDPEGVAPVLCVVGQGAPVADTGNVTAFRRLPAKKTTTSGPNAKRPMPVALIFACLVVVYVAIRYYWK
jgi:hypothetical protein